MKHWQVDQKIKELNAMLSQLTQIGKSESSYYELRSLMEKRLKELYDQCVYVELNSEANAYVKKAIDFSVGRDDLKWFAT
jgi:hypothetical protein